MATIGLSSYRDQLPVPGKLYLLATAPHSSCQEVVDLLHHGLRLQSMQKPRRAFGMSGGREDGPFVVLEHLEPVPDIGGVIFPRLRRDAQIGGQERAAQLGHQFLGGIALVAPAFAPEFPVQP